MPIPVMKGFVKLDRISEDKGRRHPNEQSFWLLSGKMEFRPGKEKRMCGPGDLGVIPAGVEHEAWFPEETEVVDLFSPPREDFYTGQDSYLRKG